MFSPFTMCLVHIFASHGKILNICAQIRTPHCDHLERSWFQMVFHVHPMSLQPLGGFRIIMTHMFTLVSADSVFNHFGSRPALYLILHWKRSLFSVKKSNIWFFIVFKIKQDKHKNGIWMVYVWSKLFCFEVWQIYNVDWFCR